MMRMKKILKWLLALSLIAIAIPLLGLLAILGYYRHTVNATPGELVTSAVPGIRGASVDPFIGTGGFSWMCGHNSPAAMVPFGMVRLAPDTASMLVNEEGLNRSGYFYGDNKILGFSHTRLLGADAVEGGVFRIFPTTTGFGNDRYTRFSHDQERAFPGYYAVRLPEEDILAELTATTRVGVHRYTFPGNTTPSLLLDVASTLGDHRSENSEVKVLPDARQVEGSVRIYGAFSGRYGGLDVYFVAQFSQPFANHGTWEVNALSPDIDTPQVPSVGAELTFAKQATETSVEVRLALSYVSVENARENLESEAANRSFDEIQGAARDDWEEHLSRVQLSGGSETQQRIFYTALYRTFQMPTTFNDLKGDYTAFDGSVRKTEPGTTYYTDFSLWDSFRTVHPLFNLIAREEQRDMMASLVAMAEAGGSLPRWPSGAGYTNSMFGTPADVALSEAYLKGVRGFDIETAYAKMRQTALVGKPEGTRFSGRMGLAEYLKYGYCPSDTQSKAVSTTLEYAWCDTALSLLATELGHDEDAKRFARNATSYRKIWDPERLFFVPRDTTGAFMENFEPLALSYTDWDREFTEDFVEGSPMMWRWSVPYDPEGLVALFPSKARFVEELEAYFQQSNPALGQYHPGSHYWHGNEPFFHAAYLFNAAGRPDLTQKWVRHILDTKYDDTYVGLDGNDDGGTISAWYVLSALGIYPIAGTTRYELGAPLFEKADIELGEGRTFSVIADNYAPENLYVKAVHLNGRLLSGTTVTHNEIADGGDIRFTMTAEAHR
jgi:predicted alpha-1,2-mannosidase